MGPTWVLSAPDGPHVGPMNIAFRDAITDPQWYKLQTYFDTSFNKFQTTINITPSVKPLSLNVTLWATMHNAMLQVSSVKCGSVWGIETSTGCVAMANPARLQRPYGKSLRPRKSQTTWPNRQRANASPVSQKGANGSLSSQALKGEINGYE